jgi:hypothetical protein
LRSKNSDEKFIPAEAHANAGKSRQPDRAKEAVASFFYSPNCSDQNNY